MPDVKKHSSLEVQKTPPVAASDIAGSLKSEKDLSKLTGVAKRRRLPERNDAFWIKRRDELRQQEVENHGKIDFDKVDYFRRLVNRYDAFRRPMGKAKSRLLRHMLATATPGEMAEFKQVSDNLATMRKGTSDNLHDYIKQIDDFHFNIKSPKSDKTFILRVLPGEHRTTWQLRHNDNIVGDGELNDKNEAKWISIHDKAHKNLGLSPIIYTALTKVLGTVKSDPEITLRPGRSNWMSLRRRELANVTELPVRSEFARDDDRDAFAPRSGWEFKAKPEFLAGEHALNANTRPGDRRYQIKAAEPVEDSVRKLKLLRQRLKLTESIRGSERPYFRKKSSRGVYDAIDKASWMASRHNISPELRDRLAGIITRLRQDLPGNYGPSATEWLKDRFERKTLRADDPTDARPLSKKMRKSINKQLMRVPKSMVSSLPEPLRNIATRSDLKSEHPMDGVTKIAYDHYKITGPTGKSYTLKLDRDDSDEDRMHKWRVHDSHTGEEAGYFTIEPKNQNNVPYGGIVKMAFPLDFIPGADKEFKAGRKFYSALLDHYGYLESDTGSTSKDATAMYKKLRRVGLAREMPENLNAARRARWKIEPLNVWEATRRLKEMRREQKR